MDEKEFIRSGKKQPIKSFFRRIFSRKKKEQPIEAKSVDRPNNIFPFPIEKARETEQKGISKEELLDKLKEMGDNFDMIEDILEIPVDRLFSFGCGYSEKRFDDSFKLAQLIRYGRLQLPEAKDTVFTIGFLDVKSVVYVAIIDPYRRIIVSREFEIKSEIRYTEVSPKKRFHKDWSELAESLGRALDLKKEADQRGEQYNFVVCRDYEAYLDKTGIGKNEISKEKEYKRQDNNARKERKEQRLGWSRAKVIDYLKSWPTDLDEETIGMMQIPEILYKAPSAYFELNEEPGVRDGDKIKFAIRVPLLVEGGVASNPVLNEITAYSLGFIADGSHTYFFLSDPKRNLFLYEEVCTDIYPESTSWKGVQRALRKAVDKNKSSR